MKLPHIEILIPVYNERHNLELLIEALDKSNKHLDGQAEITYLFVNDGSNDGSREFLHRLRNERSDVRVIDLIHNFGHAAALSCALDHCSGDAAVVMDADLQDSPDALPALFYAWKNGAKTAVVERGKRAEKGAVFFKVFYWLLHRVSRTLPPISFGSHSILDRTVVHRLRSFTESNRYFPGLVALSSPDIVSIRRNREPRRHGTSRVGFFGLVNLAITALLSFSNAPVRLVSLLGIVCALGGFGMGAAIIGIKLLTSKAIPGWASMMTLIAFGSGLQLLCLGLIGEYVARIYDEVKGRPLYWVDSLSSDVNTSRAFGQNRKKEVA